MNNKNGVPGVDRTARVDVFFWAVAVFLAFWALGTRTLWAAEGRWAEITREMLLTGRFFHPAINGVPYFDKPLITYWFIALVSPLTGMNEWALRIPSAVCGLAALWATRRLGAKLWSPDTGRLAGWILLTVNGFLFWARTGQADMANMAFIMLAVLWYWHRREKPCFVTYLVFYLVMFVGAQMKGLTAFIIPALVVFPDLLREKRWKNLFTAQHFAALFVGSLVYVLPFVYSSLTRTGDYQSSGLYLVFRENVQRFFDPFDHVEPVYVYLRYIPVLFLPWTPVLVAGCFAVIFSGRRLKYDWNTLWAGLAGLLIFLFFTASGSRRSYYILPILPFCALFSAKFLLSESLQAWRVAVVKLQAALLLIVTFALWVGSALLFVVPHKIPLVFSGSLPVVLLGAAVVTSFIWIILRARPGALEFLSGFPPRIAALVFLTAVLMGTGFCLAMPRLEGSRTEKPFVMEVKKSGRDASQIAFFDHYKESMVFYLDMCPPYHPIIPTSAGVYEFLNGDSMRVILVDHRDLEEMLEDFPSDRRGYAVISEEILPVDSTRKASKKTVAWSLKP